MRGPYNLIRLTDARADKRQRRLADKHPRVDKENELVFGVFETQLTRRKPTRVGLRESRQRQATPSRQRCRGFCKREVCRTVIDKENLNVRHASHSDSSSDVLEALADPTPAVADGDNYRE